VKRVVCWKKATHEGGALAVSLRIPHQRHWPGKSAVGKRIRFGTKRTVVDGSRSGRYIRERGFCIDEAGGVRSCDAIEETRRFRCWCANLERSGSAIKWLKARCGRGSAATGNLHTYDGPVDGTDVADRTRPMILLACSRSGLVLACIGVIWRMAYAVRNVRGRSECAWLWERSQ